MYKADKLLKKLILLLGIFMIVILLTSCKKKEEIVEKPAKEEEIVEETVVNFGILDLCQLMWQSANLSKIEGNEYTMRDLNDDGIDDFIINTTHPLIRYYNEKNKWNLRYDYHGGAAGSIEYLYDEENETFVMRESYSVAMFQDITISKMDGIKYGDKIANFHKEVIPLPNKEYDTEITCSIDGKQVIEREFNKYNDSLKDITLNNVDTKTMLNYKVKCTENEMENVLEQYAEYAEKNSGLSLWEKVDINGDGVLDGIYVFNNACSEIISKSKTYEVGEEEVTKKGYYPHEQYFTVRNTSLIVLAVSEGDGVLFQTVKVNVDNISDIRVEEEIIIVNDSKAYIYISRENKFTQSVLELNDYIEKE